MSRVFRFSAPFIFTFLIFAVMITAPVIVAQATCPQIVEEAISVLGNSCEGVTRNSACYGNIDVQSRFVVGYEEPFDRSGDIARLANLQRLTTVPYNPEKEEWGIALLSVQANIPDTIPGQSVIFMLMGSAQIENAVEQNGALVADRIPIITRRSGSLRQAPSATSRILTFIPQDVEVLAYNQSDDGGWLRVSYNGRIGWMSAQMVDTIPNFSQPDTFNPMQAFYLRTGIGRPDCLQAPDTLMVQSPENLVVDLTVNGVEIRVGSTIFLQNPTQSSLQIVVADGQVTVYPDTPNAFVIPEGAYSTTCLETVTESLGSDDIRNDRPVGVSCWTPPQPFTDWDKFVALTDLPPNLLAYDFDLPIRPIETPQTPIVVIDDNCVINPDWTDIYIVRPNDTLSSIAPNYNLTAEELGFGNCLDNLDLIVPNQELQVPPRVVVMNPPVDVPPPPPPLFVDLEVDIVASMTNPEENQPFLYTVTVTNAGTQDATGVVVNVPCANVHVRYDSDSGGGAYNSGTGDWTIGIIPAGSTVTLQINVTARPGEAIAGGFDTTATVSALTETDSNLANNTATVNVDIGYYTVAIFVDATTQVVADDGLCSLTEAINNANGNNFSHPTPMNIGECATGNGTLPTDTIHLNVNVTTTDAVTYSADGTNTLPPITSNIYMDGFFHQIQLVAGTGRLFHVAFGNSFILKDVTLTGGNLVGQDGAAIYNRGALNLLTGTNITGNIITTTSGGGGGIYNEAGTVVIFAGASVNNNTVNSGFGTGGGGIKSNGGSVTVNGGAVNNNTANNGLGGGISCTNCTLMLMNATINNNTAQDGGGIYLASPLGGGIITANNVSFDGNNAVGAGIPRGGALMIDGGVANITLATFNANTVTNGFGGAFYVQPTGVANFTDTTFNSNQTIGGGSQGGVAFNNGAVTFNRTTFMLNTDAGTTATIIMNNGAGTASFTNTSDISVGHATPQCGGGGFSDDATNTGGDGSCYP